MKIHGNYMEITLCPPLLKHEHTTQSYVQGLGEALVELRVDNTISSHGYLHQHVGQCSGLVPTHNYMGIIADTHTHNNAEAMKKCLLTPLFVP